MTSGGPRSSTRAARLLLVLLLAAPTAAASGQPLTATAIRGDTPLQVDSGPATLLAESGAGGPVEMDATAREWSARVVSDAIALTLKPPYPVPEGEPTYDHREVPAPAGLAGLTLGAARHAGAKILLLPLSDDYRLSATSEGSYAAACIPKTVLESSHDIPDSAIQSHPDYYEYTVGPSLDLNLTGGTTVRVTGDVEVYIWGFTATLQGDGAPMAVENGYTGKAVGDLPGAVPVWEEYYNYTVLRLHGAQVSLRAAVPVHAYASAFDVQPAGQTELMGATGSIGATGGTYRVSGDASLEGSSFQWTQRDDGTIGVRGAHVDSAQGSVSFVPTPWRDRWWFPWSIGAGALGTVAVAALALPSLSGLRSPINGETRGWRGVRARGYARWALAADAGSRYGRAAFWMGRAARASPRDAQFLVERGIFLRLAGRPLPALEAHRAAHDLLSTLPDSDMAHNAYEAAKAAVAVDLRVEALDWLRLAVETEPALAEEAQLEPAFAPLRSDPDYQSLTGPARLGGLLGT